MRALLVAAMLVAGSGMAVPAPAAESFLAGLKRQSTLTTTVPENGDQNPYAVVVTPAAFGDVEAGDVLVTNFNNGANLQGTGSTIVAFTPATKRLRVFAQLPRDLAGCPGGVGLGTAVAVLRAGWVVVGSAPSRDGTTATRGEGCLMVLDAHGQVAETIAGPQIDMPWGNMAVIDRGESATLFVSMAGFGIGAPPAPNTEAPATTEATVLRLELSIPAGKPPAVTAQTVVASGFGAQPDRDVFLVGPTGLALGADGTLYVSDSVGNRINAIWDAATRGHSAGIGRVLTRDGMLARPLAMATAPNGHLLVTNGQNGQVIEVDPATGEQVHARWIDPNKAQEPPGSGDLFGLAMTPDGSGFYYVEDEVNNLVLAK